MLIQRKGCTDVVLGDNADVDEDILQYKAVQNNYLNEKLEKSVKVDGSLRNI